MTELQWLIKILTKHKLSSAMKDLFIERIGEVEARMSPQMVRRETNPMNPLAPQQSASTQRILNEMASEGILASPAQIAQTPSAAAALESRQLAIKQAASGKPEPGRTSPRKF
jgi:hypothetical protein